MIDFAAAVRRLPRGRAAWVRLARHHLRNLGGLAALLAATTAHAEGSRTLFPATYPAGGFRADLDLTVDATPSTAPYAGVTTRRQFLYVYANAGEYIVLGSSNRNPANGGDILVFNPQSFGTKGAETIPATADFTCSAATPPPGSFSGGSLGYIDTRQHELDGPRSADGTTPPASGAGYSPCAYRAPVTGIYGVRFTVATSGGTGPTGSVGTLHIGNATVAAWDVTVRSSDPKSVTDINGRVFTYAYVAFTGNNSRPVFHTLYYATTDGQRYQQDMQGFDPNGYALWANVSGFLDNGQPLYKDIRGGNAQITPGSGQFIAELSAEQPQMPIFFSSIDPSGPNAATATTVLQALGIPLNPPTPQLSNVAFNGLQSGNQTYLGGGGTFTFTTQNDTTYQIIISAGVDFDPGNPANATLTGLAPDGNNTVTWNGLANNGTTFPTGTFNFQILGRNGEIHFPIIDDEGSQSGGPVLTKLNGSNLGDHTVFYDDRGYVTRNNVGIGTLNGALCGAANPVPPAPDHSLTGQDSSAKTFSGPNCNGGAGTCYYRYWPGNGNSNTDCASTAGFGDAKALDLWSYQQTPTTSSTVIINPQPAAAMVSTLVGVPATAFPGATVNGSFDFQNVGGSSATGVTYSVVIGTPGNCPTGVAFGLLPAGVTFTSYNAVTCAASFSGMPTTLASGARLNFNFSYTAPNSGSVPVTTTINSSNGGSASSTGTTQIIVADVIASVSVPATAAINSVVNGTISFSNSAAATAAADNVTYSASIGTAGSCPTGVSFPSLPPGATASYNTTSCQVTFAGLPVSLSVGQSLTIGFQYTGPGAPGSVSVAAAIGTSTPESTTANNSSSGSTTFSAPNLTLAKAGPATAAQGAAYNYTINLGNSGAVASGTTLTVADQLPAGVVANSVAAGSGVTTVNCGTLPSAAGALLTCTVTLSAALPPGAANGTASFTLNATAANVGSITNFASVDPTGGTSPPTPGAGCTPAASCGSATTTINPAADLAITKTDGVTTVTAGGTTTYTITASNAGPSAVTGATVADTFAAAITSASWSCVGSGGGTCTGSGSGNINDTVNLPVGASVTYTVTATISSAASGTLANTATVTAPAGVTDPTPGNNSATDTDTITRQADLAITKTDGTPTYTPGGTTTYTITASNAGPSAVTGATVADTFPAAITSASWSCVGSGGGSCTGSGSGNINDTVNLPVGASVTYTVTATISSAASGTLVNTATVTAPAGVTDPTPGNNSATDSDGANPIADLTVTKTANPAGTYLPGQSLGYTITVRNNGPSDIVGGIVTDSMPTELTGVTWSCVGSGGGTCTGSGSGNINDTVNLPRNATVTYTVSATVQLSATGAITNTVAASPPAGTGCTTPPCTRTASVTNNNGGAQQVSITKSATPSAFAVGQTGTYSLLVSNTGSTSTTGSITVSDPLPSGITTTAPPSGSGWDCSASTATMISCTTSAVLLPGANAPVINVPVTIAPGTASPAVNTATVSGGGDATCPGASHCQSTIATPVNAPQIDVTKTLVGSFVVGQSANYVITATNNGQADTLAGTITDPIPAGLTIGTPPPGCSAVGQNLTCALPAGIVPGGSVSYTIPVTPQPSTSGTNVSNTATANNGGDPTCPGASHCDGTVTNTVTAPQLSLTKSATPTTFVVNQTATYSLTLTNTGTAATTATATIRDTIPGGLAIGTLPPNCSATGQDLTCTVAAPLAVNSPVTFNIPVTPGNALNGQSVTNTAGATGGGDPGCPDGTPIGSLPARCVGSVTTPVDAPQLTLIKSASGAFSVGVAASYTLQVTNTGTVATSGTITITDVIPAALTLGTLPPGCSASGQQVTCTIGSVLAVGAATSFVIPVTPTAAAVPSVTNTATAQGGGDPTCPTTANCSSTVTTPVDTPQLTIQKSASAASFVVNVAASYTLQVTNTGTAPTTATATISDVIPGNLTLGTLPPGCSAAGQTVTCTVAAGLAPGASTSFVIPVTPTAAASGTTLSNTATVQGGGDPTCPGAANCSSTVTTPVDAPQLQIVKSASASAFVVGVPASYTLQVTNIGSAATTATATITDVIPGTLALGTLPPGCGAAGQTVTCTIAAGLATGTAVSFVIPVTPTAAASGTTLTNTATVQGGGDPTCPGAANCSSTVSTPVGAPQLQIVKSASSSNFAVGMPASYTLQVTNIGGAATTATATVTDNVPATLAIGLPPPGCSVTGQMVTCTIASGLAVNASVSFVIPVTPTPAAAGTAVTNTATVSGGGDPTCPGAANCTSTAVTPVNAPALRVVKTASAGSFSVGVPASYTITVSNVGGAATTAPATVSDNIPGNLALGTPPGGCSASGQQLTCTIAAGLAPGASTSFVIPVTPTAAAAGTTVSNTATVQGGGDPTCPNANNANCSSTVDVPVASAATPNLVISKTGPATATAGGTIAYTITVTNNGGGTATNAVLNDPAPPGLTFVSASAPCSGGFPCNLGNLAASQSVSVTAVTFTIAPTVSGNIVNTATVVSDQTAQTSSSAATTVQAPATAAQPVPVDARWMLFTLLSLLAGIGARQVRARR